MAFSCSQRFKSAMMPCFSPSSSAENGSSNKSRRGGLSGDAGKTITTPPLLIAKHRSSNENSGAGAAPESFFHNVKTRVSAYLYGSAHAFSMDLAIIRHTSSLAESDGL